MFMTSAQDYKRQIFLYSKIFSNFFTFGASFLFCCRQEAVGAGGDPHHDVQTARGSNVQVGVEAELEDGRSKQELEGGRERWGVGLEKVDRACQFFCSPFHAYSKAGYESYKFEQEIQIQCNDLKLIGSFPTGEAVRQAISKGVLGLFSWMFMGWAHNTCLLPLP